MRQWETFGQAKVALKGPEGGKEALELLQKQAKDEGLATVIISGTIHIFRKHLYSTNQPKLTFMNYFFTKKLVQTKEFLFQHYVLCFSSLKIFSIKKRTIPLKKS